MNVVSGGVVICFFDGTPDGQGWNFESPKQLADHLDKNWWILDHRLDMDLRPYPAEMYVGEMVAGKAFKSQIEIQNDFFATALFDRRFSVAERYFAEAEAWLIADGLTAIDAFSGQGVRVRL